MADGNGYILKSYQYLRITIVVLLAALGFAVAFEIVRVPSHCVQGSISAYYYTPVRPILIAALIATGCSMIAIKAVHEVEDILLNVAGVMAMIVALVPTGPPSRLCPADGSKLDLTADTAGFVANNVPALLASGALAIALTYVIGKTSNRPAVPHADPNIVKGLTVVGAFIVGGFIWYQTAQDNFLRHAHSWSAAVMFLLIAVVVIINARRAFSAYARWYGGIVVFMVLAAAGVFAYKLAHSSWRHNVFAIELLEIVPFTTFWAVQTVENWNAPIDRVAASAPATAR